MTNEEPDRTKVMGKLLGERQRRSREPRTSLAERAVATFNLMRFPCQRGDSAVVGCVSFQANVAAQE